ncbi:hypothetical protein [Krasilnikovia sp. M28-CT-15]|uniref:hypothetical protein n=1 Tax=Krasilnikovia sp. M28-CT-15 TaxID=3373540 RepID=UPI003877729D
MNGDIAEEPLARAVLRHLAATRGKDDPLGSFARTVLTGEASLRTAANLPWHSEGLAAAARKAEAEQNQMSAEERAGIERAADQLRSRQEGDTDDRPGENP